MPLFEHPRPLPLISARHRNLANTSCAHRPRFDDCPRLGVVLRTRFGRDRGTLLPRPEILCFFPDEKSFVDVARIKQSVAISRAMFDRRGIVIPRSAWSQIPIVRSVANPFVNKMLRVQGEGGLAATESLFLDRLQVFRLGLHCKVLSGKVYLQKVGGLRFVWSPAPVQTDS